MVGHGGMVSTQEAHATQVGVEVLREGGNAVDAAVTVGLALAVTLPRAGNLGGGGFMLIHLATEEKTVAIDYRETAPETVAPSHFHDDNGKLDVKKIRSGALSVGVPGTVSGLAYALEKYGTIPLARALQPAIRLAEQGFETSRDLHDSLTAYRRDFEKSLGARAVFYRNAGGPPTVGDRVIQKDLARTLRLLSEKGAATFYTGEIAARLVAFMAEEGGLITARLVAFMAEEGGLITAKDLESYRPVVRKPIEGDYPDWRIVTMPSTERGRCHLDSNLTDAGALSDQRVWAELRKRHPRCG